MARIGWPRVNYGTVQALANMRYRGIEFEVVQTVSPTGWKWTFQIEGQQMKTGKAGSRAIAIVLVQAAIDKAIRMKIPLEITKP